MMDSPPSANIPPAFWRSKPGIALGMVLVIVLFYLAREHYGHVCGFHGHPATYSMNIRPLIPR